MPAINNSIQSVRRAVLALIGLVACACPTVCQTAGPSSGARLGMNLNGPADWNTELPFIDVFHLSREWISQQEGKPWGQGPKLDLDDLAALR
jgi:hypothetical protein